MGSFEKLIVLTLVFLSIIVLVFSLGNQGSTDPYGAPGRELERAGEAIGEVADRGAELSDRGAELSDRGAGLSDRGAGLSDRRAGIPSEPGVDSLDGLSERARKGARLDLPATDREFGGMDDVAKEGDLWDESDLAVDAQRLFEEDPSLNNSGSLNNSESQNNPGSLADSGFLADSGPSQVGRPAVVNDGPLLLSAGEAQEVPEPGMVLPDVNDFGQKRILLSTEGLERTVDPDSLAYTTRGGETWSDLSRVFYGNAQQAGRLRHDNEDADLSVAGQTLFLPIYAPEYPNVEPRAPRVDEPAPVARGSAPRGVSGAQTPATAEASGQEGVLKYVTQDGDTLSSIAKQFYDNGNKWALIFEANSDVLSNPNVLSVGIEIRLPGATRP